MNQAAAFRSARSYYFQDLVHSYLVENRVKRDARVPSHILRLYWKLATKQAVTYIDSVYTRQRQAA